MTNNDYYEHTPPLFKSLNILNLSEISRLNIASYTFKHKETLSNCAESNHTGNQDSLRLPRHKLSLYKQSLMYQGPKKWNDIPPFNKHSPSLKSFLLLICLTSNQIAYPPLPYQTYMFVTFFPQTSQHKLTCLYVFNKYLLALVIFNHSYALRYVPHSYV